MILNYIYVYLHTYRLINIRRKKHRLILIENKSLWQSLHLFGRPELTAEYTSWEITFSATFPV